MPSYPVCGTSMYFIMINEGIKTYKGVKKMKVIEKTLEVTVLLSVTVAFGGYALFVYPFEKLSEKLNPEVKRKQLKYASQN